MKERRNEGCYHVRTRPLQEDLGHQNAISVPPTAPDERPPCSLEPFG
jgi:hypothetical protein